jgi:flagellum-specific peptidoglycan hydrolase FlgJ
MLTPAQVDILKSFYEAAKVSRHIFPEAAACEAVLETAWGTSSLYTEYRNIFGQKQSHPPIFTSVRMPSDEEIKGKHMMMWSDFVVFPTAAEAFKARMNLLLRLAPSYPAYNAALHATTPEDFLAEVSKAWSTDSQRSVKCISILHSHRDLLPSASELETI